MIMGMKPILRIFAIGLIFVCISIAWLILGGIMHDRTSSQGRELRESVSELWGQPQTQQAPSFTFHWETQRTVRHQETVAGKTRYVEEITTDSHNKKVSADSTDLDVNLHLDQRLKGLMWYSLYDVGLLGQWSYVHTHDSAGTLVIDFAFPDIGGVYDDFNFVVNGEALELTPDSGHVTANIEVSPGERVQLSIGYESRGLDSWAYMPARGVARLKDFNVRMHTDFIAIDFPAHSMSPSEKIRTEKGWELDWAFKQVVTGHQVGMSVPKRIQPGKLAASLSLFAPISLLFFFVIIWVLASLRNIDIHPINYLFMGSAFFAFHLLFSYSVDHLTVIPAFVMASVTSIVLVVSYLRLVVSSRFAFVEAAAAQLVYLVGFSMAHFWEGYTGLTITVLSVMTLFILMQLTGRIRWTEVLSTPKAEKGRVSPSS